MSRIGILGGTFNPIHIGHLAMAETVREKMDLKKIIFVPAYIPPHKKIKDLASADHRYNMVRLAIKGNPSFEISDFEIAKRGKSYTIETVLYFRKIYPQGTEFFFIIGGDMLLGLTGWKRIDEILGVVSFVAVNRPRYINKGKVIQHCAVTMPELDVSSSYLRQQICLGNSTKYLVPENVRRYIKKNKLYKK